jgi:DNA (cytosine-5)-methyltransferase 1
MLIECTTELVAWGKGRPDNPRIGDGSTYRWWLSEVHKLGYRSRTMYLNSQFFGVPQSRDRIYIAFWDERLAEPDLDHRPQAWCRRCDGTVESVWAWRTGIPPSGRVSYGEQYHYVCPRCSSQVVPPMTPSLHALDLSDLGTRIGDRKKPLAAASMARAERCRQRFGEFPAVLMPAKAVHGTEKHPWQPMATQTSQQETAIVSTGALMKVAGNTFERDGSDCRTRTLAEPLFTQTASEEIALVAPPIAGLVPYRAGNRPTLVHEPMATQGSHEAFAVLSAGVVPYRANTIGTVHAEPMPAITAQQIPGLITAAGIIETKGGTAQTDGRARGLHLPVGSITGIRSQQLLFSGWYKQNGGAGDTAPHPLSDPLGTITARDTTAALFAEWRARLADITLDDCMYRMMFHWEVGRGCGFDCSFGDYAGSFKVWGGARDIVDGYGNAVSPAVGEWISMRLKVVA